MKVMAYIRLTFIYRELKNRWTGECTELGTATFGNSLEDIKEKLEEAVLCHLNTLEDLGERKRFFKKHGIKIFYRKPKETKVAVCAPYDPRIFVQPRLQSFKVAASYA